MQVVSSFSSRDAQALHAATWRLEHTTDGLEARCIFPVKGCFVYFVWPDWPRQMADDCSKKVAAFHANFPHLKELDEGSEEWKALTLGCVADPESAAVIGLAFQKRFGASCCWVRSRRDPRGRIDAMCHVGQIGDFSVQLAWRNSSVAPTTLLSPEYWPAFHESSREVLAWAGKRVGVILQTLRKHLTARYSDRFRGLYVFGSYARPDAGIELPVDSDLDVAVLLSEIEDRYREIEDLSEIAYDLSLEHGLSVSLTPLCEDEFRKGSTNFAKGISAYAKPA